MPRSVNELVFDVLLVVGAGIAFVGYMLGVLLDPIPALGVGIVLLVVGLFTVVPREKLAVTSVAGLLGLVLAGVVAPRYVAQFTGVPDELSLSLLLSGVVLLLTVALLHVTTFAGRTGRTA